MELQDLFDDLENKFAGPSHDWKNRVNCLKVHTMAGEHTYLLAPILGVHFVAGLDQDNADWLCFSNSIITSLIPSHEEDDELPLLRQQDINLVDFIKTLERPVRVAVKYQNRTEGAFNLLDVAEQFLVADSGALIPAISISQIRVLGTNKWQ
jgi:hypothetical protein